MSTILCNYITILRIDNRRIWLFLMLILLFILIIRALTFLSTLFDGHLTDRPKMNLTNKMFVLGSPQFRQYIAIFLCSSGSMFYGLARKTCGAWPHNNASLKHYIRREMEIYGLK